MSASGIIDTTEYLTILTVEELRRLCHGVLRLSCNVCNRKAKIIHTIEGSGLSDLQQLVFEAAEKKYGTLDKK